VIGNDASSLTARAKMAQNLACVTRGLPLLPAELPHGSGVQPI
jgi:hypothetical protein